MATITINPGTPAEEVLEVPDGAVAFKYADPIEDWYWVYTPERARQIEAEDPALLMWVTDPGL